MARTPRRGSGWVTMADVAAEVGVSVMTVSRALRAEGAVSEEVRARVAATAARLGFIPNLAAGNLSSSRSRFIAATVPTLANSNFATTVQGLTAGLRDRGYQLLLAECGYAPAREAEAVDMLLGRRPDGLVLTGMQHDPRIVAALRAHGLPVVEIWEFRQPGIDLAVGFSVVDAARDMVCHLIERGRRRIGYVDSEVRGVARFVDRREAVRAALAEAGLPTELMVVPKAEGGFAAGRDGLFRLTAQDSTLDALLCATDVQAVGAIFACQDRGWAVPGRLAIAGFGDFEIAAAVPPGLTTVRTRGHAIGFQAATLILARLDGAEVPARLFDVGYEIVVRGST